MPAPHCGITARIGMCGKVTSAPLMLAASMALILSLVACLAPHFRWPAPTMTLPPTVGELLADLMGERNWQGVHAWKQRANDIAPTLVGGSKKHGGPDLGPTRARQAWAWTGAVWPTKHPIPILLACHA